MRKIKIYKRLLYFIEFCLITPFYFILSILPIYISSYICGKTLRLIGPLLKVNQTAKNNIKLCFPEFSDEKIKMTTINMWENLGRIFGELPHWHKLSNDEFLQLVKLKNHGKNIKLNGVFISAHFGCWEAINKWIQVLNIDIHIMYRRINNPFIDKIIKKNRLKEGISLLHKDSSSLRKIIKLLKNNGNLGALLDQRTNTGVEVKFFNQTILAPVAIVEICKKYEIPIHIIKSQRTNGTNLIIEYCENIDMNSISPQETMQKIYSHYEEWIKENPAQWFWVHNRFRK